MAEWFSRTENSPRPLIMCPRRSVTSADPRPGERPTNYGATLGVNLGRPADSTNTVKGRHAAQLWRLISSEAQRGPLRTPRNNARPSRAAPRVTNGRETVVQGDSGNPAGPSRRRDRGRTQPQRALAAISPSVSCKRPPLLGGMPRLRRPHAGAQRQEGRPRVLQLRREALCRIPGVAGRNSKGCSWVQWLTRIRKVNGTIACQESGGHAQVSGVRRRGTRVIWRKLHCLKPNLQKMERRIRRKDAWYRRHALRWHSCRAVATFGAWSVAQ